MYPDYFQKPLLRFSENEKDYWTIEDAVKGISIMGGTGSGKTSASGKTLAYIFLKEGWGGLVLCAKTDEAALWEDYCKETNRQDDLIIFRKGAQHMEGPHKGRSLIFNPIDYEMTRPGDGAGETQNITNIFMNLYRMGNRIAGEGEVKEERYWDMALKRCLNRTIELIKLCCEELTIKNMVKIVASASTVDDTQVEDIINTVKEGRPVEEIKFHNFCEECLVYANLNVEDEPSDEGKNSLGLVNSYFRHVMPTMGDKTRSVVTESFMGLAEPFLSGLLYNHFSGPTNIFPEMVYQQNKIIVLDFSVKEHLDAGIMAQSIFKLLFQQAIERRDVNQYPTPVFLWADEAQYFVNPYDQIFLTTARSSRTATVYLSQNISNYLTVMGSGPDAKPRVDSLMGNLSTKIFHANSDAETNEYASRLIGNAVDYLVNAGTQQSHSGFSHSDGVSGHFLPQVHPREFGILKSGGISNDYKVHAVITCSGKTWSTGKNYFKKTFIQNFKK